MILLSQLMIKIIPTNSLAATSTTGFLIDIGAFLQGDFAKRNVITS